VEAEQAGFDGLGTSDHLQPWWEGGESAHSWVWMGAALQATSTVPIGTAVTPPGPRYHPVMIAQAWATMEAMYPGRPYLGFGSGESLNESPLGADWPAPSGQVSRMDEALGLIRRLWQGETVDHEGEWFSTKSAVLHTLPERQPPIYISAFGPKAAAVAGKHGDGLWTLADPEMAPKMIEAYNAAASDAGREPGEIILQAQFSWASSEEAALEGARVWKGAQPEEFFTDDWHDPKAMYERGEEQVSDDELKEALIVGSDPDVHVERVREIEAMGATTVALMNVSGADPRAALGVYRDRVLPALRG
jgi:coenzyme F420-dependent glucose-6-phosphate dehydrogenase